MQGSRLKKFWSRGSSLVDRLAPAGKGSREVDASQSARRRSRRVGLRGWGSRARDLAHLERASDLFMDSPEIVLVYDRAGTIRGVNRAAESFFGFSARALLGRDGACFLGVRDATEWRSWTRNLLAGGSLHPRPMQLVAQDGFCTDVQASLAPLRDRARRVIGFALNGRLTVSPDEGLDHATLMMLVHEMRTPLTSVVAIADLLHSKEDLEEHERRELAGDVLRAGERLNRMLDHLLEAPTPHGVALDVRPRRMRLEPCIAQAVNIARAQTSNPVHMRLADSLPEVLGDPDRVIQVVLNLLTNALHHSPEHGQVNISAALHKNEVCVRVRDQGPGIPKLVRAGIFQAYARAHETDDGETDRFGLGLYVCRRIIEGLGGQIVVDCPPSGGSVFSFTLPRASS